MIGTWSPGFWWGTIRPGFLRLAINDGLPVTQKTATHHWDRHIFNLTFPRPRLCGENLPLSRIYRLGEKRDPGAYAPPEIFWKEYALRCNLVHFEKKIWQMLRWYFILFFSRDHVPCNKVSLDREYLLHGHWPRHVCMIFPMQLLIYWNDNNIFWGGSWALWGGGG